VTVIAEWIKQAAARRGDAPYLEDAAGAGTLTYAGLRRSTAAWADGLDRAGVPPGGRVAVRLPDPLSYATALVAILGAGRVVVPLDPGAPAAELSRVLAAARPQATVCDPGEPERSIRPNGPGGRAPADHPASPGGTGGIFLCTSGTTGAPKGILLREDQLATSRPAWPPPPADRGRPRLLLLPLFHVNAEVVGLLATLAAGAGLVLDRKFSRRGFWELIEQQRITWINAVPAIITVLAMRPARHPPAGRVRFVRSASAPLPPSVLRRFEARPASRSSRPTG
jgi:acyl-CoA synthetase (AMP-forming)/AMP-acid ligase II